MGQLILQQEIKGFSPSVEDFVFEVDTTKAGSASNTFIIPISQLAATSVGCIIYWGDDSNDTLAIVGAGSPVGVSQHTYAVGGVYTIRIQGTFNRCWSFKNAGDKLKLLKIKQWGTTKEIMDSNTSTGFMRGCSNLSLSDCTDGFINTSGIVIDRFRNCINITNIPFLELWTSEYWGSSWGLNNMFNGCTNLNEDFGKWKWNGFTGNDASAFMTGVTLSVANYNSTLNSLLAQKAVLTSSRGIGFGNSVHSKTQIETGTTTGVLANKLIDSTQNFLTTVSVGDAVRNQTVNGNTPLTYALVSSVDSNTQLTLNANIFTSGQSYKIFSDAVTKAKADVISTKLWTISDLTIY
jgi:hypothetical protein